MNLGVLLFIVRNQLAYLRCLVRVLVPAHLSTLVRRLRFVTPRNVLKTWRSTVPNDSDALSPRSLRSASPLLCAPRPRGRGSIWRDRSLCGLQRHGLQLRRSWPAASSTWARVGRVRGRDQVEFSWSVFVAVVRVRISWRHAAPLVPAGNSD